MLILQSITYTHPDKMVLFADLDLSVNKHDKVALVGNNGAGKSTLLKIMAGELQPSSGAVQVKGVLYYLPQVYGQYDDYSVAEALQVQNKLTALHNILNGNVTADHLALLDDDWGIEERCREAFAKWGIAHIILSQSMGTLSGGQKTKVLLAGIAIHDPDVVLLDEPSNHLDAESRDQLYDYIASTNNTLVVVSHDRTLLNMLDAVVEINEGNIAVYGGNYQFYAEQKQLEADALAHNLQSKEKDLRKARDVERQTIERQQKLDARGKRKQEKAGLPTISMNTLRNNAEKSTSRIKDVHADKTASITNELKQLRKQMPGLDKMKVGFGESPLHAGKVLFTAIDVNVKYNDNFLWQHPLSMQIFSGQRIAINGNNGSGKTTLLKMIMGNLQPTVGSIQRAAAGVIHIDQDYSIVDNSLTVYEQAMKYNTGNRQEHEIKIRLTHFLFTKLDWDKPCGVLSGGEKMRLILCCLTIQNQAPDIIVLDEPTNNLDIQNIQILTQAVKDYKGTMIVVSHDTHFVQQLYIEASIELSL